MEFKEPQSVEGLVYFTNRATPALTVKAWVYKESCPKCKKALMGKPVVKGKVKIRAKEYVCPECNYTEEKEAYEDKLTVQATYICPHCKHQGKSMGSFMRKKVKRMDEEKGKLVAVEVFRLACEKCKGNIDITKKMK